MKFIHGLFLYSSSAFTSVDRGVASTRCRAVVKRSGKLPTFSTQHFAVKATLKHRPRVVLAGPAMFTVADDEDGSELVQEPLSSSAASNESSAAQGGEFRGLHAGYVLIASILLGLGLGYCLDLWLESFPWGMVGGAAFFIVAGLYQVVKEFGK